MTERLPPYPAEPGIIGRNRMGGVVALRAMTPEDARRLGRMMAAIDPWKRAGYTPERLEAFFAAVEAGAPRYRILCDGQLAGVMIVRHPWLHGPYLHFLGVAPEVHSRGIGSVALGWLEEEARGRFRNLWLCVSAFNVDARRFYERHGYGLAATLDGLVFDDADELLMRKRVA